jgi:hypothetical protein
MRDNPDMDDLELDPDESAKVKGGATPQPPDVVRKPSAPGPVPIPYPNVPPDPPKK